MSQKCKTCSTSHTFRWQGLSVKGNGNFAERLIATQSPGTRSRSRPTALENFQTVEMQDSRLILLQALAAAESGRSTWPAACSRPVHCVHLLHLPAPTVHLPAVCCKPLQPPCNSPAVSALPPDVVTDAPVAAFGCGEPCSGWTAASVRRLRQRLLLPSCTHHLISPNQSCAVKTKVGKDNEPT